MKDKGVESDLALIGAKGIQFFRSLKVNVVAAASHLDEDPKIGDLLGAIKIMLDAYTDGTIDRLFLVYNEFVSTMSQKPIIKTMIPVEAPDADELSRHWDYIYEPDAVDLLDGVNFVRVRSRLCHALLGTAHFAGRHHLHRLGDLLRILDTADLGANFFQVGHRVALSPTLSRRRCV